MDYDKFSWQYCRFEQKYDVDGLNFQGSQKYLKSYKILNLKLNLRNRQAEYLKSNVKSSKYLKDVKIDVLKLFTKGVAKKTSLFKICKFGLHFHRK
jgi:hypothetical protein